MLCNYIIFEYFLKFLADSYDNIKLMSCFRKLYVAFL